MTERQNKFDPELLRAAIRELETIVSREPQEVRTILKLGDLCHKAEDNAAASRYLFQAALIYKNQGEILKSLAVCKQILRRTPEHEDSKKLLIILGSIADSFHPKVVNLETAYRNALERNDTSTARKIVNEYAKLDRYVKRSYILSLALVTSNAMKTKS